MAIVRGYPMSKKRMLPERLRRDDAMLIMVMLHEEGNLDDGFWPKMEPDGSEMPVKKCAFLADGIAGAIGLTQGKWVMFESFWNRRNMRQGYQARKNENLDMTNPNDFEQGVLTVFRKAILINPSYKNLKLEQFFGYQPLTRM